MDVLVTHCECMTAVGYTCPQTTVAARAGINRYRESDDLTDGHGESAVVAPIVGLGSPLDPWDASSCVNRLQSLASHSLSMLVRNSGLLRAPSAAIHLLLGVSPLDRPGPRYEGIHQQLSRRLSDQLRDCTHHVDWQIVPSGHASGIEALMLASAQLQAEPNSVCIVGALDSLIESELAGWLEEHARLKTASFGRNHGIPLGEAVGFLLLETSSSSRQRPQAMARLAGCGASLEHAPFLSDTPTESTGLTDACRYAIFEAGTHLAEIDLIVSDLTGEFHRSRDWAFAEHRNQPGTRQHLATHWHPADSFGCVGAASGVVQVGMAAYAIQRGWAQQALVLCTDDAGPCGAAVLQPVSR